MTDLTTTYLGLKLKNPLIVGSSGLTNNLSNIKKFAEAGVGAIVLKSIFEEQILFESNKAGVELGKDIHAEAYDYIANTVKDQSIVKYLELIEDAKKTVDIPIIASINCLREGDWVSFAKQIEEAGADALELNIFVADFDEKDSAQIEASYIRIIEKVRKVTSLPIAVKLAPMFSNIPKMLVKLSHTGIAGLVMFNRFMSPDIDLNKMKVVPANMFSSPNEITRTIRWVGLLSEQVQCDISATTGVHSGEDVVKLIMVGATTVQVCSALYINGIDHINTIMEGMNAWLKEHDVKSIEDIRGEIATSKLDESHLLNRYQYMKYYSGQE